MTVDLRGRAMTPEQRKQVDEAKARLTMGWTLAQLREVYAEGAIQAAVREVGK